LSIKFGIEIVFGIRFAAWSFFIGGDVARFGEFIFAGIGAGSVIQSVFFDRTAFLSKVVAA
jgi:hypothetical protein